MKLAIKGHKTRGKEVIQLLEMFGGRNQYKRFGSKEESYYFIDEFNKIDYVDTLKDDKLFAIYTLEEFEKLYPYKVGEKVIYERQFDSVLDTIIYMEWEDDEVLYVTSEGYCVSKYQLEKLPPYKEENMKELKELIIGFTKDDNGDWVLNTHKDYEIKEIEGKYKVIKKKSQYPKTYEECCEVLGISDNRGFGFINLSECENTLMSHFIQLKRCRDAYWKIAGEQMGLGKPWKPDCTDDTLKYGIRTYRNRINCNYTFERNGLLLFPTEEMQNEFYKNFRELIEECKELL